MPKLIISGGTDVGEMALFSPEKIPEIVDHDGRVQKMEEEHHLIRLPAGADGGYLLHLYLGDSIDKEIYEFCDHDNSLSGDLHLESGRLAFGGLESVDLNFQKNENIRNDKLIESGKYVFTAYKTEYPEEYIEDKCSSVIGEEGQKYLDFSACIIGVRFIFSIAFLFLALKINYYFFIPLLITAIGTSVWLSRYTKSEKYQRLEKEIEKTQSQYPSMVIKLRLKDD